MFPFWFFYQWYIKEYFFLLFTRDFSSWANICSPIEVKKTTPFFGDQGSYSSGTTSVDEVEESLGWIYDLKTSGSLCLTAKNGIWVWDDGVELQGLDGVSGVVGIKLLPLATNLPLESLSLHM